jgi:hypothetical protein
MAQTDILATMNEEIDEAVALLRPHYPNKDEVQLRRRAEAMRSRRYEQGRWPSSDELAAKAEVEQAESKLAIILQAAE